MHVCYLWGFLFPAHRLPTTPPSHIQLSWFQEFVQIENCSDIKTIFIKFVGFFFIDDVKKMFDILTYPPHWEPELMYF